MGQIIYKVLTREQWDAATAGGPVQASIDVADGYVHFSTAQQLQATLSKWFKGQEGCFVASFDADDFGATLKWEKARGDDLLPHVYGDVRLKQMKASWQLGMGPDGAPLAPPEVVRGS
jgi:uncharacterized protein (DUF952 family)